MRNLLSPAWLLVTSVFLSEVKTAGAQPLRLHTESLSITGGALLSDILLNEWSFIEDGIGPISNQYVGLSIGGSLTFGLENVDKWKLQTALSVNSRPLSDVLIFYGGAASGGTVGGNTFFGNLPIHPRNPLFMDGFTEFSNHVELNITLGPLYNIIQSNSFTLGVMAGPTLNIVLTPDVEVHPFDIVNDGVGEFLETVYDRETVYRATTRRARVSISAAIAPTYAISNRIALTAHIAYIHQISPIYEEDFVGANVRQGIKGKNAGEPTWLTLTGRIGFCYTFTQGPWSVSRKLGG